MKKLRITNPHKFALGAVSLLLAAVFAVVGVRLIGNSVEFTDTAKLNENLTYNVYVDHYGPQKALLAHYEYKNLITNAGFAGVASRLNGSGAEAAFTYVAIGLGANSGCTSGSTPWACCTGSGTGTCDAAVTDTTLVSEITTLGGARAAASVSRVTTTVTNDTAQWVITYAFTGSFAVRESGILNAASTGTLLARRVFSVINVVSGDSIQITWKCQAQ